MYPESDIKISLCIYIAIFGLCHLLRYLLRRILSGASYQYAVEFVDTFNLVCCLYENGMVLKVGILPFSIVLFTLTILYSFIFEGFTNPAAVLDFVVRGKLSAVTGVTLIVTELLSAVAAYHSTSFVWKYVLSCPKHSYAAAVEMLHEKCSTGLKVSPFMGFTVEMLSVTILKIVAGIFHGGQRFWRVMHAITCVLVIIYGLDYTGAFMNPVLGFASGWGCKDHHIFAHLLVYWLGPTAGIMIGDKVIDCFRNNTSKGLMENRTVPEHNGNHKKVL